MAFVVAQFFLHVFQIGFVTLQPYAVLKGDCLEFMHCNTLGLKPDLNDQLASFSAFTLLFGLSDL